MAIFKLPIQKPSLNVINSKFIQDNSGNFGIMSAILISLLLGASAMAVDLSNAMASKSRLQDTTDAIALMAVKKNAKTQTELTKIANSYLATTYNADGTGTTKVKIDSIIRTGDRVTVSASEKLDVYLANLLGHGNLDVVVHSEAIDGNKGLDMALVLDTTGSMSGAKLASLKTSANSLIDKMSSQNNDKIRMSIVPFSQYVNVGKDYRHKNWIADSVGPNWEGCVGSRSGQDKFKPAFAGRPFPTVVATYCPNALQPLTKNMKKAKNTVSSMKAEGWTYMPAGLAWGLRTLEGTAPFTQANQNNKAEKVLILMSDGANTKSASGSNHNGDDVNQANQGSKTLCNKIKAKNIKVYTIAFQLSNNSADKKARKILENCASNESQFFDVDTAGDLNQAFDDIANSLIQLRLSA